MVPNIRIEDAEVTILAGCDESADGRDQNNLVVVVRIEKRVYVGNIAVLVVGGDRCVAVVSGLNCIGSEAECGNCAKGDLPEGREALAKFVEFHRARMFLSYSLYSDQSVAMDAWQHSQRHEI
jgi:hypothetical protein